MKKILTIHTISHAFTDMACAALIYKMVALYLTAGQSFSVIILYDFVAFCWQLPFGMWLDKQIQKNRKYIAGIGMYLIAIAMAAFLLCSAIQDHIFVGFLILLAAVTGLGNALFHVGAGVDTLQHSGWPTKAAPSGIFVCSGAMGLYLGAKAEGVGGWLLWMMICAMVMLGIFEFTDKGHPIDDDGIGRRRSGLRMHTQPEKKMLRNVAVIALLFVCIIIYRSFLGFAMKYTWRVDFITGLIAVSGIVLGKFFGGILSDRFGWRRAMTVCLVAGAIAAVFSENSLSAGVMTLFLFNMTMPTAMVGLVRIFPDQPGMAFGLNTMALFIGFAIHLLTGGQVSSWLLSGLILFSVIILFVAITPLEEDCKC